MDGTPTLYVVEDDADLREHLRLAGEQRGYRVRTASDGMAAREGIGRSGLPDIFVLDVNMPGMDGFRFCRWLRDEHPPVPVVFLSARTEEYDKIIALELGGDDYMTKPFSMKELFVRIEVALRRVRVYSALPPGPGGERPLERDGIRLDPAAWTCEYRGRVLDLTVSEFRILRSFLSRPGAVATRESLAAAAFPEDRYNSGRSVDVHVCRIRQKLQAADPAFAGIETVYQVGYKWKG
jgi:DNA-binding response OmpR family regulator